MIAGFFSPDSDSVAKRIERAALEDAMEKAEATLDVAALELAISSANDVGISAEALAPAESCLKQLRPRAAALALLTAEQRARCLPLLLRTLPISSPRDLESAMVCVAHAAIWEADGVVYGGYVRDYICGGRQASDIDVNVSNAAAAAASIVNAVGSLGISGSTSLSTWGAAQRMTLQFRGQTIEVDLVVPDKVPWTAPGVDCSANNLEISRSHGLTLKAPATESVISLEDCIKHAQYKQMVVFYAPNVDKYEQRMNKMARKGFKQLAWTGPPMDAATGLPCSWTPASGLVEVDNTLGPEMDSAEYLMVTNLLSPTSLGRLPELGAVRRVQNAACFLRYRRCASGNGEPTLMFHGCSRGPHSTPLANEDSIVQQGFRVNLCKSGGGSVVGTWFAYAASYSDDNRYAITDAAGWKHLFVCMVSKHDVRKDDAQMRVVGQDAAYPQWVVEYR